MNADEMLARALQEEEVSAAQQRSQQQLPDAQKAALLGLIQDGLRKALSVEDPALIARARAALPIDNLRQEVQQKADLNAQLGEQQGELSIGVDDMLVQALLSFFKREFFSWVDQPSCELCTGPTSLMGMAAATPAEAADGAGRVEVYRCSVCQQLTRFARYINPGKLLETRKGRCGEWAHTFLLVLRAAEQDARHLVDNADHVWCEYYSTSLDRWVHVDACEEAWDTPLLYEGGWGKSLSYVFAASRHGVADVTRRYVLQPRLLHARRTPACEAWLLATLTQLTSSRRAALDATTRRLLGLRDAAEALQLMILEDGAATAAAAAASLPGRQSGSEAWRSARGESGAAPQGRPPTAYCHAADTSLPSLFSSAGRITGGVCRASGENRAGQPSQQVLRLFDGSLSSKWLDFGSGGAAGAAWAEYRLLPSQTPCTVSHYDIVSAEDCPERDPYDWVLECVPVDGAPAETGSRCVSIGTNGAISSSSSSSSSTDKGWIVIDWRQQQCFDRRHQLRSFHVPAGSRMPSRQWRLRVTRTADPCTANSVQLACWNLYSSSIEQAACVAEQQAAETAASGSVKANLYMRHESVAQLVRILGPASGSSSDAAAAAVACEHTQLAYGSCGPRAEAVSTLKRVLTNMRQNPSVVRFWQVSATAAKLQALLHDPLLLSVLFEAGFRPLLAPPAGGATLGEEQLRLVADENSANNMDFISSLQIEL